MAWARLGVPVKIPAYSFTVFPKKYPSPSFTHKDVPGFILTADITENADLKKLTINEHIYFAKSGRGMCRIHFPALQGSGLYSFTNFPVNIPFSIPAFIKYSPAGSLEISIVCECVFMFSD